MTITERIFNRFGFISEKQFNHKVSEVVKAELDRNIPVWLGETADAAKYTMPDPTIFANQADMYRLSPILGTAVNFLGADIGTSKANVKRLVGEEVRDVPNHEFELRKYGSLRYPNPADSGIEFLQYTVSNYLLNGNSIWWCNRASQNQQPDEIWPVPFSMVTPVPDEFLYIDHYDYFPGAGKPKMRLETYEIVHFKTYNPNSRFIGLSPLESLAVTLHGDSAMRKTNTVNYAEHGGAPQSILAFKEFVNNEAWEDVKKEKREAAKRNEMMMLRGVGDGVSWLQRALSNKDMDFIASLQQNMTDVFNRMCPGLLNILSEGATYSNADAARSTYAAYTKWPVQEVIAQKITSDIMPSYGRNLFFIFDDPRVTDRVLELEEQKQYSLTHTLDQINKEYYEDKPIGDERGDLLLAQINASTGKPESKPVQPPEMQLPATEALPADNANEAAPIKADLMRWKRYELRTFGKAHKAFESVNIPDAMAEVIKGKLAGCKSVGDVADLFEEMVKTDMPKNDIARLAAAIEKAVDEIENPV